MRVGAVGCVAKNFDDALLLAKESALPTHNHSEGIKGAQAIAAAVYMARNNYDRPRMKSILQFEFGYDLDRRYQDIYDAGYTFNVICQTTVPEALICFFESESYIDCICKTMLTNKDTDTAAAVAGAVAGAYYGIVDKLREKVLSYLPDEFKKLIAEYDKDELEKN